MKNTSMRRQAVAILAGAFFALSAPSSLAQSFPDRPVSLVVAYSPGGATDFQARIVTMVSGKEEYLGMPIVIFNRPGAGGKVGWNRFAQKPPPTATSWRLTMCRILSPNRSSSTPTTASTT